jgi:hypothetical protein
MGDGHRPVSHSLSILLNTLLLSGSLTSEIPDLCLDDLPVAPGAPARSLWALKILGSGNLPLFVYL